jgi:glutamyl-tRNA synthetase
MILGSDGKRLSKRHGAVSVLQYREEGFLPEALINYLARLGWSHGDQEIFSVSELIHYFDIKGINKSPAAFNLEKLLWLNQHYMKTSRPEQVAKELAWHMEKLGIDIKQGPLLVEVIRAQAERTKTLREMAERSRYFYGPVTLNDEMKSHVTADILPALKMFVDRLAVLSVWSKEAVHEILMNTAEVNHLKLGKLAQPVRVAITGGTVSPPIDMTIVLVGRERTIERLHTFMDLGHL